MTSGNDFCSDGRDVGTSFASMRYVKFAKNDPATSSYYLSSLTVLDGVVLTSFHSQYTSSLVERQVALHAFLLSPGYVGRAPDHSAVAWSHTFGEI